MIATFIIKQEAPFSSPLFCVHSLFSICSSRPFFRSSKLRTGWILRAFLTNHHLSHRSNGRVDFSDCFSIRSPTRLTNQSATVYVRQPASMVVALLVRSTPSLSQPLALANHSCTGCPSIFYIFVACNFSWLASHLVSSVCGLLFYTMEKKRIYGSESRKR